MAQIKQDHGTRIPKLFIFFIIVFLSMTLTFVTAYAERPQKNLSPRTNLPIIEKSEWIIECPEKRNVMTSLGLGLYEFVNKKADYALQDVLCKSLETKNHISILLKEIIQINTSLMKKAMPSLSKPELTQIKQTKIFKIKKEKSLSLLKMMSAMKITLNILTLFFICQRSKLYFHGFGLIKLRPFHSVIL